MEEEALSAIAKFLRSRPAVKPVWSLTFGPLSLAETGHEGAKLWQEVPWPLLLLVEHRQHITFGALALGNVSSGLFVESS